MNVRDEYFNWLYNIVCGGTAKSYYYLMNRLYSVAFQYTHPLDGNRAADGEELRYTWGHSYGYADPIIASTIDDIPCSVLEMIVALAMRCEGDIMTDSKYGDRTAKWIWVMLKNLGLIDMDDEHYDDERVCQALDIFMSRQYNPDGSNGALFVLKNPRGDLRDTEVWYQAMWYLSEKYERR
jgi:hypothetical protein